MEWDKFFAQFGGHHIVMGYYGQREDITVNALYEFFKDRLKSETEVFCGKITDKEVDNG